jgi:methyltransferase (TIGR00027 family)
MHVENDPPPHVLEDEIGLQIAGPEDDWRARADMDPSWTGPFRAGMVGRGRFVEDLVLAQVAQGATQYVILGAGLDTFAQREPGLASRLRVFEVDRPGPQAWKRQRLVDLGFGLPEWLRLVPVDFEVGVSWPAQLASAGFHAGRPAIVAATGLFVYLSRDATATTLRHIAALAPGSTLAATFMLPLPLVEPEEQPRLQATERFARAAGTPMVSFFTPAEMLALARAAGFGEVRHVSAASLAQRYFAGRTDGLRPSSAEELLVATT